MMDNGNLGDQTNSQIDPPYAVEVLHTFKGYNLKQVLRDVELSVTQGEFYALMGPNGSGKSTLAAIIASVVEPDSGTVRLFGKKPREVRKRIGYVPQDNFSVPLLTGRENIIYFAGIQGFSARDTHEMADELLERVGLTDDADKRASQYSGGMRKRLELATALFPGIDLLILDEPTTGLDPGARRDFLNLVKKSVNLGTSVLLITHLGSDAELAGKIGMMYNGSIVAEGTPESLKKKYTITEIITIELNTRSAEVANLLSKYSVDGQLETTQMGYRIHTRDGAELLPQVVRDLDRAGISEKRLGISSASLEDVFFRITEHPMHEVNNT